MEQFVLILLIALISFIHWVIQKSNEARAQRRARRAAEGGGELLQHPGREASGPEEEPTESMRRLMEALGLPTDSEPPALRPWETTEPPPPLPPVAIETPASIRRPPPEPLKPPGIPPRNEPRQRPRPDDARKPRAAVPAPTSRVRSLLASESGLRDAIVLSEILGPPKGLRG